MNILYFITMTHNIGNFILISAPNEKTAQETWDRLNQATGNLSTNYKFNIPDLKVGTLDQLVGLSDDLAKLDTAAEQITRKLVQFYFDLKTEDNKPIPEELKVNDKDVRTYIMNFKWDNGMYPSRTPLKTLSEVIGQRITKIESDLKTSANSYNAVRNTLASMERKAAAGIMTKDLSEIVKAEDFVLNSEYLQTLMVVVPKVLMKDWFAKYETLTDMVVPASSRLIFEDNEYKLFSVTLFKKVIDEYKLRCRENNFFFRFIVRDFVYDEESLKAGRTERMKLLQEKERQYLPLVQRLKIYFGEMLSSYIHVKALRVFVESVLRYGLPVNFQAMLLEPNKNSSKKLRSELNKLYVHLDASAAGPIDMIEDNPTLMSLGMHDYYPYVSFNLNMEFIIWPHKS
ncbi:unnamed protein product [Dracunculus medinensis]|uniref:V-type proton ATPase subunit C n=1 Tax=Dracunculus medinensis TaxID=318479 RepID=A0A0N4U8B2_DRAME|nr:unnamed protein product [Dracunculus medinensis]